MSRKPAAEVVIDEGVVRRLLDQAGANADDPIAKVAEGWDCEVWRLGEDRAVRLPRRALGAPLVLHEQRVLPLIGPAIVATGVQVPIPLHDGRPGAGFPWPWSIVPWIDGDPGTSVPRSERGGWARSLARALNALHAPAPADHPVNPMRGRPLAERAAGIAERLATLRAEASVSPALLDGAEDLWARGLAAAVWDGPPLWVHGDLHPGNLVARDAALSGIIDFGDVTGGDPACDLAIAWLLFDAPGRRDFVSAVGHRADSATWIRARAWAAAMGLLLVAHSDDEPTYGALGTTSLQEVLSD